MSRKWHGEGGVTLTRGYQEDLNLKIQAGTPIIQIISYEWRRIHGCVMKASKKNKKALFVWNNSEGLMKFDETDGIMVSENEKLKDPVEALDWFLNTAPANTILLAEDLHLYFDSEQSRNEQGRRLLGRLRTVSRKAENKSLVISQPVVLLPAELQKDVYVLEIPLPDTGILETVIRSVVDKGLLLEEDKAPFSHRTRIAEAALGLTDMEAAHAFKEIALEKGRLTEKEIPLIVERKEQIIRKSGILEYFHPEESFGDVGGLKNLKKWLKNRKVGFDKEAMEFGLTPPKGVLLLGVQGCGKSLVAKAIASEWKLPLLKFDLGRVFGGIVGESEANIRRALSVAEAISPSILWIDEIEKGLSGARSSEMTDSGTTARVFGTMLTWMQEKEKPVFTVATANNIEQLPPELLRKGRFDEIFFVDLPGAKSRDEIWSIHLCKRLGKSRFDKGNFDLKKLSKISIGYSGAEIEEAINEALYIAYNADKKMSAQNLKDSIESTYPLSKVMAENIMKLRQWAKVRARLASEERMEDLEPDEEKEIPKLKQEVDNPFYDQNEES